MELLIVEVWSRTNAREAGTTERMVRYTDGYTSPSELILRGHKRHSASRTSTLDSKGSVVHARKPPKPNIAREIVSRPRILNLTPKPVEIFTG